MSILLKLIVFSAVVTTLTVSLRKHHPEISLVLSILAGVFVLSLGSGLFASVIRLFETITAKTGVLPEVLSPLLKVLSIAILTKISVDICKESGCLGLSTGIELIGNAIAITAAAPLILSMLSFLTSI